MDKVFGIGFQKTGTTSLAEAFRILGYNVTGPNGIYDKNIAANADALVQRLIPRFDAFQDNPWPLYYKHIDAHVRNAKFILTLRDPQPWIESVVKHFGGRSRPMLAHIYGIGDPVSNEEQFVRVFDEHNSAVQKYFKDRENFLALDLAAHDDPWVPICKFLGVEIPKDPFPRANQASARSRLDGMWVRRSYGAARDRWRER